MLKFLKTAVISLQIILVNLNFVSALPTTQVKEIQEKKTQIPAVSEISDINLNSWNFKALKSLNSRYQCLDNKLLEQLPQVITRQEFAMFLYQCLVNLEKKSNLLELLNQEEYLTIKRLQQEFELPFMSLKNQIEQLENKVSNLEKKSVSSNIQLEGEAIIALAGVGQNENNSNLTLGNRVRLDFITSFTGKDELQIRLQGRNIPEFEEITDTKMANLGFDGDDDNEVEIDELEYEILLTENTTLALYAMGGGLGDLIPTVNPLFSSSGEGAISVFGRENPIRRHTEGAAFSLSQDLGEKINFTLGYVSNNADEPDQGLLQSPYGVITQFTFYVNDKVNFSLTYGYTSNNIGTGTGSALAENPFADSNDIIGHSYGGELSFWIKPNVSLGSRVGWIQAHAKDLPNNPKADIFTWAIMLGVTDLGIEDSLLGVIFGLPPKVITNSFGEEFEDPNTAHHLEIFYRWELIDDVSITPGFFLIFNPEHNNELDTILVGTIRTTFEF